MISLTNELLEDERLDNLDNGYREVVLNWKQYALKQTGDSIGAESIKSQINYTQSRAEKAYQRFISHYELGALSDEDYKNLIIHAQDSVNAFYNFLYSKKEYGMIHKMQHYIFSNYFGKNYNNLSGGIWLSAGDVLEKRCTQYDLEIDTEREAWHYANGGSLVWLSHLWNGRAFWAEGNIAKAIQSYIRCVDNVRTDWNFDTKRRGISQRDEIFSKFTSMTIDYIDVEVSIYMEIASFYLKIGNFDESYNFYKKAIDLNNQLVGVKLTVGTEHTKQGNWDNHKDVYIEILEELRKKVDSYPKFSNLILESLSMLQGFMLNLETETRLSIEKSSYEIKKSYQTKKLCQRLFEKQRYTKEFNEDELHSLEETANITINDASNIKDIIPQSTPSIHNIRKSLLDNEILVNFMLYSSIARDYVYAYEDEETGMWTAYESPEVILYASIMRKGWEHPMFVNIGRLNDIKYGDKKEDFLPFLRAGNESISKINILYQDIEFGQKIWNKILNLSNVKSGETILYTSVGRLCDVALEYLTIENNITMADKYNVRRLSSIKSLYRTEKQYNSTYNCVAFGDIQFSPSCVTNDNNQRKLTNKKMSSNPKAILERSQLIPLNETKKLIGTLREEIDGIKVYTGADASEISFYQYDGKSPEIMIFATHGYHYNMNDLSSEQKNYILGKNRSNDEGENESSMYLSGLYLAPSNDSGVLTDGMLTAKEVSLCDLHNTELVILCACSSARGKNDMFEGVYGLQHGFKQAGVKSVLASLWDVDSEATVLLMREFLKQYTSGIDKHTALRRAQKYVREFVPKTEEDDIISFGSGRKFANPYYWAGFILID